MDGNKVESLDSFIQNLDKNFHLSDEFKKILIPLIEKIFDQDTPPESRDWLIARAIETCRLQEQNDMQFGKMAEDLEGLANSMSQLFSEINNLQTSVNELAHELENQIYMNDDDDPQATRH